MLQHHWRRVALAMALSLFFGSSSLATEPGSSIDMGTLRTQVHYATWQGIEPDKWATIWLIKRYIQPDAWFDRRAPNTPLPDSAIPFGVPNADIRRASRESMFRRLKRSVESTDPVLDYMDAVIHDLEVNVWEASSHPHTQWVESMYRQLQARYQRDQVPTDCYLAFFDGVARLSIQREVGAADFQAQLSLTEECPGVAAPTAQFVPAMGHTDILRQIGMGKQVVFIDTRETQEFDEAHLPGARLIRLRDVDTADLSDLQDADWVVPYCVKDFRGFEVAKALKERGITQVATLSPNGLRGWLQAGLPVTQVDLRSESQAQQALMRCAMEPSLCLAESGS